MQVQEQLKQLKQLKLQNAEAIIRQWGEIDLDFTINYRNRKIIEKFYKLHPNAHVGIINLYSKNDIKRVHYEYNGEFIYNFGISYIVPEQSNKLKELILYRKNTPYSGTKKDYELITKINDLIDELGGYSFVWQ